MLPYAHADCLVQEHQHRELLAKAARLRLVAEAAHQGTAPRRWAPAVLAPVRLAASALGRLGALVQDSREILRSKEQELAALGVTWTTDPAHERELAEELRAGLARRAASAPRYPTLAAIDRALDGARPRFAAAANAAHLEARARELTKEYWSESAWLTGRVPAAAFGCVCAALESERIPAAEPAAPPQLTELAGEPVVRAA
jgi:hypothetical protein